MGKTNARADVPQAGGFPVLVDCISFAIDRATSPVAKGGGPAGKLLDDVCKALAFLLQEAGNEQTAVEAGVLEALAKAITHQMTQGLKTLQAIAKDDGIKAKAVQAGIRKEWIEVKVGK